MYIILQQEVLTLENFLIIITCLYQVWTLVPNRVGME